LPEAVFLALRNNRGIHSQYRQRIIGTFALRVAEDAQATPNLKQPAGSLAAGVVAHPTAGPNQDGGASRCRPRASTPR